MTSTALSNSEGYRFFMDHYVLESDYRKKPEKYDQHIQKLASDLLSIPPEKFKNFPPFIRVKILVEASRQNIINDETSVLGNGEQLSSYFDRKIINEIFATTLYPNALRDKFVKLSENKGNLSLECANLASNQFEEVLCDWVENKEDVSSLKIDCQDLQCLKTTRKSLLVGFDSLKALDLSNNHGLQNLDGIEEVAGTLEKISIQDCSIESLSGLEKCPHLKNLNAEGSSLREIPELQFLPGLRVLNLKNSRIGITQHGLPLIANLSELRKLNLEGIVVLSDSFVRFQSSQIPPHPESHKDAFFFNNLTNLKELRISHTSIEDPALIDEILRSLPDLDPEKFRHSLS